MPQISAVPANEAMVAAPGVNLSHQSNAVRRRLPRSKLFRRIFINATDDG